MNKIIIFALLMAGAQAGFCGNNIVSFFCSVDTSKTDTLYLMESEKGVFLQKLNSYSIVTTRDTLVGNTRFIFKKYLSPKKEQELRSLGIAIEDDNPLSVSYHWYNKEEGEGYHKFFLFSSRIYGETSDGKSIFPTIPLGFYADAQGDLWLLNDGMFREKMLELLRSAALKGMAMQMGN